MAREWGARGKALSEKAKRPPNRSVTRTSICSPCSSPNGPRPWPTRHRHPPPSPKGCCGPKRPHRCSPRRAGRSCWNTSGNARRYRASSSPPCTADRWSDTPNWSRCSRLPSHITTPTWAACLTTAWKSLPTVSSCARPIYCPSAPARKTRRRRQKPGPPPSPTPHCSTTSERSPSICTWSWPTARSGTRGTGRCTRLIASATATIESTGCTAPQQACSTANCSTETFWTGSAAIPACGHRCSTSWPGSTSMPAC